MSLKSDMIPRSQLTLQTLDLNFPKTSWQKALSNAISQPHELLTLLNLDPQLIADEFDIDSPFPLKVPHSFVARMKKGQPKDPLLLQILPLNKEKLKMVGYGVDPVGDLLSMSTAGVIKKYNGRALLVATGACGIHCRYCFRRHFPYSNANPASDNWIPAINDILNDNSINEVILSGGDPLCLSNDRLNNLMKKLEEIPHLKRIRIHSRLPIVLPERVDDGLISCLSDVKLKKIIVLHINHPNEINKAVKDTMQRLADTNAVLFNQSVLLRGINDNSQTLLTLSETLFETGITPYYLHMLDKVQGAGHFHVSDNSAQLLMKTLRKTLPGYLVPRLVREELNQEFKTPM